MKGILHLHLGYFENFKEANTILLCGDEDGLQQLADNLRPLEDANAKPVNLHLLPFVQVYGGVSMTAYPVDRELGVRRVGSAPCFAWHHSQEGWLESAEKFEVVARGKGGHCFLGETPAGDAVIMVSKGEYDGWSWERQGKMADAINFYNTADEYGEFSNFASFPITLKGKRWPTSEHYFQAQKFEDKQHQEAIRKTSSPMIAARMGRDRKKKLRRDWESVKVGVMREAVLAKFTQHDELRTLLLSTGDAKIVEHTERDDYWGDGGDGSGKNMLGRILMQVREALRKESEQQHDTHPK